MSSESVPDAVILSGEFVIHKSIKVCESEVILVGSVINWWKSKNLEYSKAPNCKYYVLAINKHTKLANSGEGRMETWKSTTNFRFKRLILVDFRVSSSSSQCCSLFILADQIGFRLGMDGHLQAINFHKKPCKRLFISFQPEFNWKKVSQYEVKYIFKMIRG